MFCDEHDLIQYLCVGTQFLFILIPFGIIVSIIIFDSIQINSLLDYQLPLYLFLHL